MTFEHPEHSHNSLPLSTAGDASFFRSGSGEGLSELVMEFPAVLIGCTPRGSCNRTLIRRVLRRLFKSKSFLEGFLEGACKGFRKDKVLRRVLSRERSLEGASKAETRPFAEYALLGVHPTLLGVHPTLSSN